MEACVDAIGFFFAALGAGLSHFSAIESAAAVLPIEQANVSANIKTINADIRKHFTRLV
jgi:hypothetical protein